MFSSFQNFLKYPKISSFLGIFNKIIVVFDVGLLIHRPFGVPSVCYIIVTSLTVSEIQILLVSIVCPVFILELNIT
jgi:hypothetical protein